MGPALARWTLLLLLKNPLPLEFSGPVYFNWKITVTELNLTAKNWTIIKVNAAIR